MPLAMVLLALDVIFVVHAAKTGRLWPWAYVIMMIPGFGVLAYILVELVPEWMGTAQGQRARQKVIKTLNPEKRYRALADQLETTDTIANRVALAEECLALARYGEAKEHFAAALARPMGEEPVYALGKARAEFGLDCFTDTVATLDALRAQWPDYQSADGHLLYARALEKSGRSAEALEEYQALANYYPGAEARVRCGLLLDKMGRRFEAEAMFTEALTQLKRAPKYVRQAQAEWIALAQKALRG